MDSQSSNIFRWLLLLPGVVGAMFLASIALELLWEELTISRLGGQGLRDFVRIALVFPGIAVYSSHSIAPSHKTKVGWSFAIIWALFMLFGLVRNFDYWPDSWALMLSQLVGFGAGFGIASLLDKDEKGPTDP